MRLAQENNTPVPFWLDLPLVELGLWIEDSNSIVREKQLARENARGK